MAKLKTLLLDLFFPPRCAFCSRRGIHGVCAACDAVLPRRDRPCTDRPRIGKCVIPLFYDGIVRRAVLRFKFYGVQSAAEGFAQIMAQSAAEHLGGEFDCVSFVPVSAKRRRQRGYDQAFLLAREMAKLWDTEPVPMLCKTFDNPPQSSLRDVDRRRANVLGVFALRKDADAAGRRILLVDDVLTSGTTMAECVRVLKDAGAKSVVCAALATRSRD